jgi:Raf kinase inhibitor-like YbhB/YbcL family protein
MKTLTETLPMVIGSTTFEHGDFIPKKYTCEGENISPPITIEHLPDNTACLALIMEDPDAPHGTFVHWVVWNVPPMQTIWENTIPGIAGKNSKGHANYTGPCPPDGTHRYFFRVFALDRYLDLKEGASKKSLEKAMEDHILARAEFVGFHQKSNP